MSEIQTNKKTPEGKKAEKIAKAYEKLSIKKLSHSFDLVSVSLNALVHTATIVTSFFVLFLISYIVANGLPNIFNPKFFELKYTSENLSMMPALFSTVAMVTISLIIAGPLGIFAAIFLTEYSRKDNIFIKTMRMAAETLAGIPSIIYGVFGFLFFVPLFKGQHLMAGVLTVSIMVLPLIMRTAEEAIIAVPDSYREGSFGLGAGKLRTVFRIVLPSAAPGILSGIILAVGRIFGETAALILTSGSDSGFPGRTLAIHLFRLNDKNANVEATFATAFVLLLIAVLINALSAWVAAKVSEGQQTDDNDNGGSRLKKLLKGKSIEGMNIK